VHGLVVVHVDLDHSTGISSVAAFIAQPSTADVR
jgi:hypothetical protein